MIDREARSAAVIDHRGAGFASRAAAFFDRDNTLVHDPGYLGDPAVVRLLPGAAAAVAHLRRAGYVIVVVTNQSGVARGYYDEAAMHAVNRRTQELLRAADPGAEVAAFYCCLHLHPDPGQPEDPPLRVACDCRKPLPGLFLAAARELRLDLSRSVALGDSPRDVAAAQAAGCAQAVQVGGPDGLTILEAAQRLVAGT